jgi:hypothetical protein
VILWRKGARALDLWPRRATVQIPVRRLPPGTYQWFVYPALRKDGPPSYGPLTARGTITI